MKISKRRVEYSHLEGNLRLVSMTDEERKELAQQHNTEKWAISPNLYFVEFSSLNRNYRGYGIRNVNGGIEFINPLYMKNPITLDNKGYVFIAHSKDESNKHCCLFWEFTDYLAYLSIQKKHFLNLPKNCDCFIMSDVRNFIPMVVDTDDYENIYMFFPNNDTGYTIAKTIQNRNSKHVHDCSLLYAANETLHDFAHVYLEKVNK